MSVTPIHRAWRRNTARDFDVVIVGAGMVGASLACALAGLPLSVAVLDAGSASPRASGDGDYDERSTALSYASVRIFRTLDVWSAMAPAATAIRRIHVSQRGRFGVTRLEPADLGLQAFGAVVPNRIIGKALLEKLASLDNVTLLDRTVLESARPGGDRITVGVIRGGERRQLDAQLLVGADGTGSKTRDLLGIGARRHDYGASAIVANVTPVRPHQGAAFERFTQSGPMALLPLEDRCALVLTVPAEQVGDYLQMPDEDFAAILEHRLGGRLGGIARVGRRQSYPLVMTESERVVDHRAVLLGNAAHTLHPVAGQGFNLALREAATLAELLACSRDLGDKRVSDAFQDRIRPHGRVIQAVTHWLPRLFESELPGLGTARGLGLLMLELWPFGKAEFARRAMGLDGTMPALARGRALTGERRG